MGNSIINTAEDKATLFDQTSKVMELVREGNRSAQEVSKIMHGFIADDIIQVRPKIIAKKRSKIFHIGCNYKAAEEATDAGNYPRKWGWADGSPEKIPMVIQPVDQKTRMVPLGETRTAEDSYNLYPKAASPLSVLTFGAQFPDEQKDDPIFTVYKDSAGRFCCVVLSVSGDDRFVNAGENRPRSEFYGHCRLLQNE
jgi:hypothetical protein